MGPFVLHTASVRACSCCAVAVARLSLSGKERVASFPLCLCRGRAHQQHALSRTHGTPASDACACPQDKARVNVGFWGGITPENADRHDVLWGMLKGGALGFKSFVSPSGINDFENVSRADVAAAMHFLLSKGAPFFVHAELVSDVEPAEVRARAGAGAGVCVRVVCRPACARSGRHKAAWRSGAAAEQGLAVRPHSSVAAAHSLLA